MKRLILIILSLCTVCLCACNTNNGGSSEGGEYDALNDMLALNYSSVHLTITNTFADDTSLVGEYVADFTEEGVKISYSVERFAEISFDAPSYGYKTAVTGEALMQFGTVVSNSNESVEIPSCVTGTGLSFNKEYFANADLTGLYFKADVTDAEGFMGTKISGKDMKVYATYLEMFYEIDINYLADGGNSVEYKYEFTA